LNTLASSSYSHAEGWLTIASALYSHAEGSATSATTTSSHAEGWGTQTYTAYQLAVGRWNTIAGSPDAYFVVGNGTSGAARSNAFRVDSAGSTYNATGTYTSGADYAEYFESIDGLSYPYGTVVELDGDKIKICQIADNAIGVISSRPTIVGNSDDGTSDEWVGKYEKDKWGRFIMEDYTYDVPTGSDLSGNTIYTTVTGQKKKINPNYDETIPYVPRSERPEWNVVGLLGQIRVLKNQQIPSRWIKMRDIDDDIAIYLVK
jgi:hypothetical protein